MNSEVCHKVGYLRHSRGYWRRAALSVVFGAVLFVQTPLWAKGVALVVGVGEYAASAKYNLEGPANDALAMRDVLVRRWRFAETDVRVLVNRAATKQAIVNELRDLNRRSAKGDEVVVYFSGHGTSAVDGNEIVPLPYGSGAFLPYDFDLTTPERALATALVGRTDALPLYQALEQGGRKVWVISDSCYSGNQVRSLANQVTELPGRFIPVPVGSAKRTLDGDALRSTQVTAPPPWPYQNLGFLAASAEGETARDIPSGSITAYPTVDGKAHGAMTDALLRVLSGQLGADFNNDGLLSLVEAHRAVGAFMATRGYGHTPQRLPSVAEDEQGQGYQPLMRSAGAGKVAAPVVPRSAPLQVFVKDGAKLRISDLAQDIGSVVMVNDASQADVIVASGPGSYRLLLPSGDLLASWPEGSAETKSEMRGQMAQLALDKRWHLLAQQTSKGLLAAEVVPGIQGGNVRIGQKIHFSVRPERVATLLLVNIDSKGQVTTLYPSRRGESAPLPAGMQRAIPGSAPQDQIEVRLPLGMDIQFAIAFDQAPPQLERLMSWNATPADHPSLLLLDQMLSENKGRFSFARTVLRTSP